ncbi:hypothetical protein U1Q18_047017, partial [Sarracenia purpurea var. burkii]
DKTGFLATGEVKSMGSEGIKHGSVIVFADLGEENMVLEVPKVEDNEECDEVDSGTTNGVAVSLSRGFGFDLHGSAVVLISLLFFGAAVKGVARHSWVLGTWNDSFGFV